VRPEGLGNLIKIIHLIGSRTRDLPVCNIGLEVTTNIAHRSSFNIGIQCRLLLGSEIPKLSNESPALKL
jgi:hypothetical protein